MTSFKAMTASLELSCDHIEDNDAMRGQSTGHLSGQLDWQSAGDAVRENSQQKLEPDLSDTKIPDEFILDLDYDTDSVDCDIRPATPVPAPPARVHDVTRHMISLKKNGSKFSEKNDGKCKDKRRKLSEDSGFQSDCSTSSSISYMSSSPERNKVEEKWFVIDSCGDIDRLSSASYYRKQYSWNATSSRRCNSSSYDGKYENSRWRDDGTKMFKRKRSDDYYYSDRWSKRRRR